jgi:hypothetical protein
MQGDWLTIHESEAPRSNDVIIERVYIKIILNWNTNMAAFFMLSQQLHQHLYHQTFILLI